MLVYRTDVWINPDDHKAGLRPFVGTARFDEFRQLKKGGALSYMWQKMPHNQLAKCAEAAALRRAFPEPLSGLYVPEELPPTEGPPDDAIPAAPPSPPPQGGDAYPRGGPPVQTDAERVHELLQRANDVGAVETVYTQCERYPRLRGHCYRKILDFLRLEPEGPARVVLLENLAQRVRSDPLPGVAEESRQKVLRDIALAMSQAAASAPVDPEQGS